MRNRRTEFTPLGQIFYDAPRWDRTRIIAECKAVGISYDSLRGYLVVTPAYHASAQLRDIVINVLPKAADCFLRPKPETV
jgi:hypothetical protein